MTVLRRERERRDPVEAAGVRGGSEASCAKLLGVKERTSEQARDLRPVEGVVIRPAFFRFVGHCRHIERTRVRGVKRLGMRGSLYRGVRPSAVTTARGMASCAVLKAKRMGTESRYGIFL